MRFWNKGKLSHRYVVPYNILMWNGNIVDELDLPISLSLIHPFFHLYMLKNCVGNPYLIVLIEHVGVMDSIFVGTLGGYTTK